MRILFVLTAALMLTGCDDRLNAVLTGEPTPAELRGPPPAFVAPIFAPAAPVITPTTVAVEPIVELAPVCVPQFRQPCEE